MTKLSEIAFKNLKAGMIFKHDNFGDQIIIDLDRNAFGPIIKFHNCSMYSGKMPEEIGEDQDIFQILSKSTFPSGAEEWEYVGMLSPETMKKRGWTWYEVTCPHCGVTHQLIASQPGSTHRQCLKCGMVHSRPLQISPQDIKHTRLD